MNDARLMARSVRRPEAFGLVVERHTAAIWRYLARRSNPSVADDLTADVFVTAFTKRASYDGQFASAAPWLYGIARNRLLSHLRDQQRVSLTEAEPTTTDPWPDIEARLHAEQVAPQLLAAMSTLPAVEREILLLVAWEQLEPTEIATLLDLQPGTVRSRLHRARKGMQAQLTILDVT